MSKQTNKQKNQLEEFHQTNKATRGHSIRNATAAVVQLGSPSIIRRFFPYGVAIDKKGTLNIIETDIVKIFLHPRFPMTYASATPV